MSEASTAVRARRFELAFRNPFDHYRELMMLGELTVCFDSGLLKTRRIADPVSWCNMHFGVGSGWKCYVVGNFHTQLYEDGKSVDRGNPVAVYPSWEYGVQSWDDLSDYIDNPWGSESPDPTLPSSIRPTYGQKHMIFISELPDMKTMYGRQEIYRLSDIQAANPDVEFFIHGLLSFSALFGQEFTAGSFGLRPVSGNVDDLCLPNGRREKNPERFEIHEKTIKSMGMTVDQVRTESRSRMIFNAMSARQAAHYWHAHSRRSHVKPKNWEVNPDEPVLYTDQAILKGESLPPKSAESPGDKISCNHCTLWRLCSRYREGAVCTVPGTDGKKLSESFNTTDSGKIVGGLQKILAMKSDRLERAMGEENFQEGLDPHVDKMLSSLFKDGVTLAKLVDPSLSRPLVQINAGQQQQGPALTAGASHVDARQLMASVVAQLEAKGHRREDITEDMVDEMLRSSTQKELAPIDAEVVENE